MAAGVGEQVAQGARDAFLAKEAYLASALAAIDAYGGTEQYVCGILGLSKDMIQQFRDTMLL